MDAKEYVQELKRRYRREGKAVSDRELLGEMLPCGVLLKSIMVDENSGNTEDVPC